MLPGSRPESGLIFLTRTVPALLPSDFHARPWTPSSAVKNSVSPTTVRSSGRLPASPPESDLMFLTRTVPALLPLDFHSPAVVAGPGAEKQRPPYAVRARGSLEGMRGDGHCNASAPKPSVASTGVPVPGVARAAPAPASVTAAAVAAVAAHTLAERARRRRAFPGRHGRGPRSSVRTSDADSQRCLPYQRVLATEGLTRLVPGEMRST